MYATLFFVVVVQVAQLRFPFTSVLQVVAVAVAAAVVVVVCCCRSDAWPVALASLSWPEVR